MDPGIEAVRRSMSSTLWSSTVFVTVSQSWTSCNREAATICPALCVLDL